MREIEQKFRLADPAALEARLASLGVALDGGHPEADHYLAAPDRDFVATGEVFRMRRIGQENYLTYKGPKSPGPFRDREEIEVPLPPGDDLAERHLALLFRLGYRPVATVRKVRRQATFARDGLDVTVTLDDVEEVGRFCEVEVLAEPEQGELARRVIASVVADLGLTDLVPRSYLGLLLEGRDR